MIEVDRIYTSSLCNVWSMNVTSTSFDTAKADIAINHQVKYKLHLNADDVQLIQDINDYGLTDDSGSNSTTVDSSFTFNYLRASTDILTGSFNVLSTNKFPHYPLDQGNDYVQGDPINNNETYDNPSLPATPGSTQTTSTSNSQPTIASVSTSSTLSGTRILKGTLGADTFTYQPGYKLTVISGNGNVDFGSGKRDLLDLSQISSTTVSFNRAYSTTGGVFYNSGNGMGLYDSITLSDGSQILFQGIETIKFANTTVDLSVIPNDPLFNQQWNLHIMDVNDAWRFTTGSNKVLIGIEDTGLGTDSSGNIHPDLRSTIVAGNNYLDQSLNFSHGTLTQGVIAAASNDGVGIAGINWNSDVESINVVNSVNYNLATATQALLNQANSKGQHLVVNLSVTGGDSSAFDQLIANNQDKALFVIASGNEDKNSLDSPANLAQKYGNVIAVGASWGNSDYYGNPTTSGQRISYANWWGSNYGDGLTLMAPSEFVSTSANYNTQSASFDFGYGGDYGSLFNGTSAAAPNVTGVASLVWSADPNLTAVQVKSILSATAYDLGAPGYDTVYGYGLVNADAAVRQAIALARGPA